MIPYKTPAPVLNVKALKIFKRKSYTNCLDTSVRWSKAFESLRDKRLNAPQKTIMKGIISDIFSITIQEERKKYIDQELGTHLFTVAAKRGSHENQTHYL